MARVGMQLHALAPPPAQCPLCGSAESTWRAAPTSEVGGLQQVQLQEGWLGRQPGRGVSWGGPALQVQPWGDVVQAGSLGWVLLLLG